MKVLIVDSGKCIGCRLCELVCSFVHEHVINPSKVRLRVIRLHDEPVDVPVFCLQCGLCVSVCPVNAISRDPKLGCITIDYDKCVGCKRCIQVCPYGAIFVNPDTGKPMICDLCGGNPACVNVCPTGALEYLPIESAAQHKRVTYARLLARTQPT